MYLKISDVQGNIHNKHHYGTLLCHFISKEKITHKFRSYIQISKSFVRTILNKFICIFISQSIIVILNEAAQMNQIKQKHFFNY